MVDRPTNRLSAFAASNMPEPEPDRLQMLANSGRRQSANLEDVRDIGRLGRTAEMFRTLPGIFRDLYSTYTTPWQYRDLPDRLSEISALLPRQDIPPMRPQFAEGGTVDDILGQYSEPVRSWAGEDTWDRDAILPFARRNTPLPATSPDQWANTADVMKHIDAKSGNRWQFAWPQMATDFTDAAKAVSADSGLSVGPMRPPSDYSPEEMERLIAHGMTGAMTGLTGGLARSALSPRMALGEFELGSAGSRRGGEMPNMGDGVGGRKWYHGTPKTFDEFEGDAAWFASNPNTARAFGADRAGGIPPISGGRAAQWDEALRKVNLVEREFSGNYHVVDPMAEATKIAKDVGIDTPQTWNDVGTILDWANAQHDWIAVARRDGKDGVLFKGVGDDPTGGVSDQLVVFNPNATRVASHHIPLPVPREDDPTFEEILSQYAKD